MTISTDLAILNSMSSFVPNYSLNRQILVATLMNFLDKDGTTKYRYLSTPDDCTYDHKIERSKRVQAHLKTIRRKTSVKFIVKTLVLVKNNDLVRTFEFIFPEQCQENFLR